VVTGAELELREQVRDWVAESWDPQLTVRQWWLRLAESGWGYPVWPRDWFGRGLGAVEAGVVPEELAAADVLGPPSGSGTAMGGPVLFMFGTEGQKRRWLPALARGEEHWAQFFSEPGAGSDLAGVQTRAVRDGSDWLVNGQKVWNSGTLFADRALLVARTDPDVSKHKGIGFFVVDLDQPGIDIRPIRQMNGLSEFNETFLTDVRVPDDNVIGGPTDGWAVAMAVLAHERSAFAGGGERHLRSPYAGTRAGFLDRPAGSVLAEIRHTAHAANALPIGSFDDLVKLARRHGRLADPVVRQHMAALHSLSDALRLTGMRAAASARSGGDGSAQASVAYLGGVQLVRMYRDLVAEIAGPYALLAATDVAETITTAPAHGIQGGSEQIQRNVIGERLLGLPREPQMDRDVPFRSLRVGTQRDP
jgi:alkylation response protein AidB-like acyl-CoA dehydrogenase